MPGRALRRRGDATGSRSPSARDVVGGWGIIGGAVATTARAPVTVVTEAAFATLGATLVDPGGRPLFDLGQYVGDWTSEVTSKPAVWTPEDKKFRTSNHAEFVLDGRFLQHIEVNHVVGDPEKVTKAVWFETFDPQAEGFVMWFFQSSGVMGKSTGTWDHKSKSLSFALQANGHAVGWVERFAVRAEDQSWRSRSVY